MKKDLKRKLYALALAGIIMSNSSVYANAENIEDVDMTPIDISGAISELVPSGGGNNNNENNNSNNNNNNENNNSNNNNNNENNNSNNNNNNENNTNTINDESHKHNYGDVADDVINQKSPNCENGGSYDEVYYCTSCGKTHTVHVEVDAPGHKWSEGEKQNVTSTGYDIVKKCTNKGCNEEHIVHVDINTPTEPIETTVPTKPTEPKPTTPSNNNGENPKTADERLIEAATYSLLGAFGGLGALTYLYNKDNQKQKYKGKYLRRK